MPEFQYWAAGLVPAVGALTAAAGALVSILASALAVEAALWLPTLSEMRYW